MELFQEVLNNKDVLFMLCFALFVLLFTAPGADHKDEKEPTKKPVQSK